MHSRIAGTGRYLPERVLTNDELALSVATSDEWIRTRTGIRQRHVAADGQLTSDLALAAARRALDAASLEVANLDLIIITGRLPIFAMRFDHGERHAGFFHILVVPPGVP